MYHGDVITKRIQMIMVLTRKFMWMMLALTMMRTLQGGVQVYGGAVCIKAAFFGLDNDCGGAGGGVGGGGVGGDGGGGSGCIGDTRYNTNMDELSRW